jgi:cytochrome bd-type quinol oxidase subunit 2
MEPHSCLVPPQNGTFSLPQALICLLRTCFAGLSGDAATQADTDFSLGRVIRDSGRLLLLIINPFTHHQNRTTTTLVGMVKLTALCGIGYWAWTERSKKGKIATITDGSNHGLDMVGIGKSSYPAIPPPQHRDITWSRIPGLGIQDASSNKKMGNLATTMPFNSPTHTVYRVRL